MFDGVLAHHCWACGRGKHERPPEWYAPWWLQKAHLAAGSGKARRIKGDRRHIVILCPVCHLMHRHNAGEDRHGVPYLTNANTIWLKMTRDGAYYDVKAIARSWNGNPPEPCAPDRYYLDQYEARAARFMADGDRSGIRYTGVNEPGFRLRGSRFWHRPPGSGASD